MLIYINWHIRQLKINNIYYERQDGGLCCKHAINAFFGYCKVSTPQFELYQKEYDAKYNIKFNIKTSCKLFDIVSSDQKNIVSYILQINKIYTRYYALNQLFKKNINDFIIKILTGEFFFIYNESHIYGVKYFNNNWYTIDSINGISAININTLSEQKNIGFIIPVNAKLEFYNNIKLLKSVFNSDNVDIEYIKNFLIKKNKSKEIIGDLEIPLGICMDILEFQYKSNNNVNNEFSAVYINIMNYNQFIVKFTDGRYNDIELILQYIPSIILQLLKLDTNKKKGPDGVGGAGAGLLGVGVGRNFTGWEITNLQTFVQALRTTYPLAGAYYFTI